MTGELARRMIRLSNGAYLLRDGSVQLRRDDGALVVREPSGLVRVSGPCPRCGSMVLAEWALVHVELRCPVPATGGSVEDPDSS